MMAPLPTSVASSTKFLAQLAEARRLRADLVVSPSSSSNSLGDEVRLESLLWDDATNQLGGALADALGISDGLENLHNSLPNFSPRPEAHSIVMEAKKRLLRPLADPAIAAEFLAAYDRVVCNVVAPHIQEALSNDRPLQSLHYAAFPTLRVQTPSHDKATIRPHVDGMYGLQHDSVNFWLPLTSVCAASALWTESGPPGIGGDRDEYHPLTRPTRFDGRNRVHFTVPNTSNRTRVSLDFRVVPGDVFDASARLSRMGYYSRAELVVDGGDGGEWRKVESGVVTKLHGLPHERAAVET